MNRLIVFFAAIGVCAAASAQTTRGWSLHAGQWTELATTAPSAAPIPQPELDKAEALLERGDQHQARKVLLAWEKDHKNSPVRDRCIYLLAQGFVQADDGVWAFYYCDELMDEYPQSPLFSSALQLQYNIANNYLNGHKEMLFFFFRINDKNGEAVQMMFRIQQRSPGSALAEKALLRTADFYYANKDYDLAEDAYNSYIRSYPSSPDISRIRLHAAFASLAQYRNTHFDVTKLIDARTQLVSIEKDYPDMAAEQNLAQIVMQIDADFARKLLETGEFYERIHQTKGAIYDYRFLAQTYPQSPEGKSAAERLTHFSKDELAEPLPLPASGYAPATLPTASAGVP